MPTVNIHPPDPARSTSHKSSLPELLQTPLGFALLELQGTINHPDFSEEIKLGRIVFPEYNAATGSAEGSWMRKVYLYIGHQRMTGELQKLKTPLGLLRKRSTRPVTVLNPAAAGDATGMEGAADGEEPAKQQNDLEIVEIVYYKLAFRSRPEPVGSSGD